MSDPSQLSIDEKSALVGILERLRLVNAIGIVETRDWIELIFPEFADVRDIESDQLFRDLANLQLGRTRDPGDSQA